jgi:hypothetical protein
MSNWRILRPMTRRSSRKWSRLQNLMRVRAVVRRTITLILRKFINKTLVMMERRMRTNDLIMNLY